MDWLVIRKEYESTEITLKDLATKYGVSEGTMRSRKNREKWQRPGDAGPHDNATQRNATGNATQRKKQCATEKNVATKSKRKGSAAPKGNQYAKGNSGGPPIGSKNAERHGFFSRIFPNNPEIMAIVKSIESKSALDILWENIVIQYTAIARAQKIMFVKDQSDMTKELSGRTDGEKSDSKTYTIQFAWDKQASFLRAQSRAIATLEKLITRYDEMLPGAIKHEEQRLRVEKLKAEITKIIDDPSAGDENADDGFLGALAGKTNEAWDNVVDLDNEDIDNED